MYFMSRSRSQTGHAGDLPTESTHRPRTVIHSFLPTWCGRDQRVNKHVGHKNYQWVQILLRSPQSFLWTRVQDVPCAAGCTVAEALSQESLNIRSQVNFLPQWGWRPKFKHMRSSWGNKPRVRLPAESQSQLVWATAGWSTDSPSWQ